MGSLWENIPQAVSGQHCAEVSGDGEAVNKEIQNSIWLDHEYFSSIKTHELNFFPDKMLEN